MVLGQQTIYDSAMQTLGDLVREARQRKHLSQEGAAERMGVERNWLAQLETNRIELPGPARFELIERHLGVTREEMLRAAGYLGPARDGDLYGEISRIAALDDLGDRMAALRRLPPAVFRVIEAMALALVRQSLHDQASAAGGRQANTDQG